MVVRVHIFELPAGSKHVYFKIRVPVYFELLYTSKLDMMQKSSVLLEIIGILLS